MTVKRSIPRLFYTVSCMLGLAGFAGAAVIAAASGRSWETVILRAVVSMLIMTMWGLLAGALVLYVWESLPPPPSGENGGEPGDQAPRETEPGPGETAASGPGGDSGFRTLVPDEDQRTENGVPSRRRRDGPGTGEAGDELEDIDPESLSRIIRKMGAE